jgi:hypothetical protein
VDRSISFIQTEYQTNSVPFLPFTAQKPTDEWLIYISTIYHTGGQMLLSIRGEIRPAFPTAFALSGVIQLTNTSTSHYPHWIDRWIRPAEPIDGG